MGDDRQRCVWATTDDPLYMAYHDEEWGRPLRDERQLFELLLLEGAQAGLSWRTILHRREGYRAAFDQFDVEAIAAYDDARFEALMKDRRIVRNKLKIVAFVTNARATLRLYEEGTTLVDYLWQFVDHKIQVNCFDNPADYPKKTPASIEMSRALTIRGFSFVGPVICYALMQSAGMVNDHQKGCWLAEC